MSNYAGLPGFASYSVSASSPPANPYNGSYSTSTNYVEVDISQTQNTALSGLIGWASTTKSVGHSVAYDAGPPAPFGFTFFSKGETDSGNQVEKIQGDVFLGDGYKDQSMGQAGLCVQEIPEPSPDNADGDSDGGFDNDLDNQGHVVFGVLPPPTVGPEPLYNITRAQCPSSKGGGLLYDQQVSPSDGANCPAGATPKQDPNNSTWVCYMSAQATPDIPSPTPSAGAPFTNFCGTIDDTSPAGVYTVASNCLQVVLNFDGAKKNPGANINCISLVLGKGTATRISWENKAYNQYMTSYGYSHADSIANNAITALGATPPGSDCPGAGTASAPATNNRSVVWAPDPGSLITSQPVLTNMQTGCCSDTLFVGTIFVPNRQIIFATNQAMEDVGAIYCGDWQGQAGNHPNPTVTYDTGSTAFMRSALRLVE